MIFGFLTLFIALAIAGVAGWFSIVGLMAIFSASATPIAIMAGTLEVAKLLTASWLYRNWKTTTFLMKAYLMSAVLVLMIITSMGIFGYLSKAHLDQKAGSNDAGLQIERIESRIAREQKTIADAETVIGQLDQAVQTLIDYDRIRGPDGSLAVRKSQQPERDELAAVISQSEARIDTLRDDLLPLKQTVQAVELEVGPLKYVAELIYQDDSADMIDRAVRLFILMFVFVFDPLAVILVVAANQTLMRHGIELEGQHTDTLPPPTESVNEEPNPSPTAEPEKKSSDEEQSRIADLEATIQQLNQRLSTKPKAAKSKVVEVEKIVEVPVEVERVVEVENTDKIEELAQEVERLLAELEIAKASEQQLTEKLEKQDTEDMRIARELANSVLNKEDLSETEIFDMIQKNGHTDVRKRLGFWATPMPKEE